MSDSCLGIENIVCVAKIALAWQLLFAILLRILSEQVFLISNLMSIHEKHLVLNDFSDILHDVVVV